MSFKNTRGSVTVEASLVLPIFISAVLTVVFLIKLVHVHEVVQHAINGAADEMASTSYLFYISGLSGVHDALRDGLEGGKENIGSGISAVSGFIDNIADLTGDLKGNTRNGDAGGGGSPGEDLKSDIEILNEMKDHFQNIVSSTGDFVEDPLKLVKSIGCIIAGGAFDDMKTELFVPLVKLYTKKYLAAGGKTGADKVLKAMNVSGGLDGLDFYSSNFFADEDNNIDIVVRYRLDLPVPFRIFNGIYVVQRAVEKAWTNGDSNSGLNQQDNAEDIWSLDNFKRGSIIRQKFGANLPSNFPVIAAYNSGTATMIKSMDLTTAYYQDRENVKDKILGYVDELYEFKGGKRGDVEIKGSDVFEKVMKLVIPENAIKDEISGAIDECVRIAGLKGIKIEVIRYQHKKLENDDGGG